VLSVDGTTVARSVPNLPQLQALNDYYSWRRAEAHKRN
jgi:hypothetical protein